MKRNYAETFFRHRVLLMAPVLIAFALAAFYGLSQPRKYAASAAVWTDRQIPFDSTIGTTGGGDSPAGGQQALLSGLLASRTFLMAVAQHSPMAAEVRGSQQDVDSALWRLAGTVTVTTPGPQVLTIAVEELSPQRATGLAQAFVEEFIRTEQAKIRSRAETQVAYDKKQLDAAAKQVSDAQAAVTVYAQTHPDTTGPASGSSGQTDPGETSLVGALAVAQQHLSEAEKAYTASNAALTEAGRGSLELLDQPTHATPLSRRKIVLISGVGGLLAGGSISLLILLLLVTRDRAVREEADLEQGLGLQVVSTIKDLPALRPARRSRGTRGRDADPAVSRVP
ncbi:MAG: hypothetical protein ACJ73E_00400 [Mycobacteriales bacterium]